MSSSTQSLLATLRALRAAWPRRGWSYDNRFDCVASTFDTDTGPAARALITPIFGEVWTSRTLLTAPPAIRELAERTGGVRSSQLIFSAAPIGALIPYGLWWPWEEGATISLRIGLEGARPSDTLELCAAFGTEP